ncbi:MAG: hypothetical protein KJ667_05480, partial [Alphaproteobacteria bacterium]|nr:hypothetical protein [Alphaproteobacteria bacterium]
LARLENVSIQVDVNPSAPEITAAQSARWHGCLSAVNVLNLLYAEKYQSAREQALPALRESLTVVTRDIEALDKNGGMLAYEAYRADKSQKDAKALAPPLLPTDDGRPAQKFITGGA